MLKPMNSNMNDILVDRSMLLLDGNGKSTYIIYLVWYNYVYCVEILLIWAAVLG